MSYLPLTRLIAATGGIVLPLMASEAFSQPLPPDPAPTAQARSGPAALTPEDNARKIAKHTRIALSSQLWDVDK